MIKRICVAFLILTTLFVACKKEDDLGQAPRLFRPVVKDALESNGNWIKASWQAVKGAKSYSLQVSRDTFKTIAASVVVDTNVYTIENLLYDKLYQVQVRAIAPDTSRNSGISSLGSIKTARFPTILNVPTVSEINDNSVKVTWTNSGATVTSIKILKASDSSVVTTVALNATDVTNQYKIVSGLNAVTPYIIFLYSGTTVRGFADFITKAAFSGNLIDLRGITGRPSVLQDTIPIVGSGSTIILRRGETYNISSTLSLDKSLTFIGGTDLLVPDQPLIYMPSNFNMVSGTSIDSLVFIDVILRGSDYSSKYVFNISNASTIGKIKFENCLMEIFRGVTRLQSQPTTIGTFEINKCIIDSISNYGVVNVDVVTSKINNIRITNSTIYKAEKIVTSRNNAVSVVIDNNTFNEAPLGNNYFIDFSTSGTNQVTNPISFKNNILGLGKDNAGNRNVNGYRVGSGTSIDASGTYTLADFQSTNATYQFPGVIPYTRASTEVWQNPTAGNFKIIDNLFPGRNTAGDPRWRP